MSMAEATREEKRFTPYATYRDSGVDWIGELPCHWESKKIKRVSPVKRGASPRPIDDPIYFDNEGEYAWVRISDVTASDRYLTKTEQRLSPVGQSKSVCLEPGDLFLSIAGSVGKAIITSIKCCIHDGFVYFPCLNSDPEFLYYIFKCGEVYKGLGKTGTQLNLNTDWIGNITVPTPDISVQRQIVAFLDRETARIDEMIAKKQRLIELLEEKRTALISHAVTKGLNPNAPMKDSGIEWLGKIPEQWEVKPLKRVLTGGLTNGIFKKKDQFGSGTKLINVVDLYQDDFIVDASLLDRVIATPAEQQAYAVHQGDVFFVRSSLKEDGVGQSACVSDLRESTIFECHLVLARPDGREVNPDYLILFLNSSQARQRLIALSETVTMTTLSQPRISSLSIPLPPIAEQSEVALHVRSQSRKIADIIRKNGQAIQTLQEYRTALISAAVTGKIDVRDS